MPGPGPGGNPSHSAQPSGAPGPMISATMPSGQRKSCQEKGPTGSCPDGVCLRPPMKSCDKRNAARHAITTSPTSYTSTPSASNPPKPGALCATATGIPGLQEFQDRHGRPMPSGNVWLVQREGEVRALERIIESRCGPVEEHLNQPEMGDLPAGQQHRRPGNPVDGTHRGLLVRVTFSQDRAGAPGPAPEVRHRGGRRDDHERTSASLPAQRRPVAGRPGPTRIRPGHAYQLLRGGDRSRDGARSCRVSRMGRNMTKPFERDTVESGSTTDHRGPSGVGPSGTAEDERNGRIVAECRRP